MARVRKKKAADPPPLEPPSTLAPEARKRCRSVVPDLQRRGSVDTDLLAIYCQVWVRWRQAEETIAKTGQLVKGPRGGVVASPLIAVAKQAGATVRSLELRLGIGVPGDEPPAAESTGDTVTRRQLADRLGVHMQTVTKWEQDGMPIASRGRRGKPSTYREADVRAWLQAREDAAKSGAPLDLAQQRALKEMWQARLAEQTLLARSKELLPRQEVEKVWAAEVAAVRAKLLAIPATLADRVCRAATLEGVAGVENVLQLAIHDVLRELAEREPSADESAVPEAVA